MNAARNLPAYLQAHVDEREAERQRAAAFNVADERAQHAAHSGGSAEAYTLHLMGRALTRTDRELFNHRDRYEQRRLLAAQRLIGGWSAA